MIKAILVIAVIALTSFIWFGYQSSPPADNQPAAIVPVPLPEARTAVLKDNDVELPERYIKVAPPPQQEYSPEELAEFEALAQTKQVEIEELIQLLDQNLTDKRERDDIQEKLDALLAEYDELILPVIMQQLKERDS